MIGLNALLARDSQSIVRLVTPLVTTQLNVKPYLSTKFESNSSKYNDTTELDVNRTEWNVNSKTHLKDYNNSYYNFILKHLPQKQSLISAKIPSFDSQVLYNKESPKIRFEFSGKQNIPYNHMTEFEVNPEYEINSPKYSLKSRTNRLNGQNVLSLNGHYYSRNQSSNASHFEVKYGQQLEGKVELNLFSRQKSIDFEAKTQKYNHKTCIRMDTNSLEMKSETDDLGKNKAKIDLYLTSQLDISIKI